MFEFKTLKKQTRSRARIGSFKTPHGELITPEYTFVATEGEIKAIPKEKLTNLPVNLIIVNTFHILAKNIMDDNSTFDIHEYAQFPKVIMSDSGGFQVLSLGFGKKHGMGKVGVSRDRPDVGDADLRPLRNTLFDKDNPLSITEEGVTFVYDDKKIHLTPEKSIEIQQQIGADIIFAFDECTSPLNSKEYTQKSMERTHRWLERCIRHHRHSHEGGNPISNGLTDNWIPAYAGMTKGPQQALFGIVQGGEYKDLRIKSAKFVGRQDVAGFGIGGSFGENSVEVLEWTIPYLPEEKPRHFLGIGRVRDVFEGIEHGVDTFDCVIPTREARHKVIYTRKGKVSLRKMKNIDETLDKDCMCETCQKGITFKKLFVLFSNVGDADLRPLHMAYYYATVHNIQFFSDLMKRIRESIEMNKFFELKEEILKYY